MKLDQEYTSHGIRTYTGKCFDIQILDPDSICIDDIAHALSHTSRFGGHLEKSLSVAQHSYYVALNVAPKNRLAALLHDASEAYIGDMPSPFKKLMPDFKKFENDLMMAIAEKLGFDLPLHKEVKEADKMIFDYEWDTFIMYTHTWFDYWEPEKAKDKFLEIYRSIKHKR